MSALEVWLTIGLLTLATLLTRSTLFLLGGSIRLPEKLQHALRYAPAAALAAIVIPDLVLANGSLHLTYTNPKLLAGLGAAVFFLTTRHMLGTIIVGMTLFTVFRLWL